MDFLWVFVMLQYFENISPLVENLCDIIARTGSLRYPKRKLEVYRDCVDRDKTG